MPKALNKYIQLAGYCKAKMKHSVRFISYFSYTVKTKPFPLKFYASTAKAVLWFSAATCSSGAWPD